MIHYVTKGSGYYEVNNQKYKVSEGEIFIINPNMIVTYYSPVEDETWSFCWMGFSGASAAEYLSQAGISNGQYTLKMNNNKFY